MPCLITSPSFPHQSYAEYINQLAKLDFGYDALDQFFEQPLVTAGRTPSVGSLWSDDPIIRHPEHGIVAIIDVIDDALHFQTFKTQSDHTFEDREAIYQRLNESIPDSSLRLVFVGYHRNWWRGGKFAGVDKEVMDHIAVKYRLHPSIVRMHFACDYGLSSDRYYRTDFPIFPYAASQRFNLRYCHGFLTAYLHGECSCESSNTSKLSICNYFFRILSDCMSSDCHSSR